MSDLPNNDLQIISDVDMPRLLDVSEKTWETMKKRGDRHPSHNYLNVESVIGATMSAHGLMVNAAGPRNNQ
jgi:hypothetical protein